MDHDDDEIKEPTELDDLEEDDLGSKPEGEEEDEDKWS